MISDEPGRIARIASVGRVFCEEAVYDLTVEEDHSFVTRAGAAHNCRRGTTANVADPWRRP